MEDEVLYVGRKAGIAYLAVSVAVIVGVLITLWISDVASSGSSEMPIWFPFAVLVIVVLGILKWRSLRSIQWVITEDRLLLKRGFLPWTKATWSYASGLHDVSRSVGFFSFAFGYGTIELTTTHGTTQRVSEHYMKNTDALMEAVLELMNRWAKKKNQSEARDSSKSTVDELTSLAELLDKGAVTQSEFDQMKAEILSR